MNTCQSGKNNKAGSDNGYEPATRMWILHNQLAVIDYGGSHLHIHQQLKFSAEQKILMDSGSNSVSAAFQGTENPPEGQQVHASSNTRVVMTVTLFLIFRRVRREADCSIMNDPRSTASPRKFVPSLPWTPSGRGHRLHPVGREVRDERRIQTPAPLPRVKR